MAARCELSLSRTVPRAAPRWAPCGSCSTVPTPLGLGPNSRTITNGVMAPASVTRSRFRGAYVRPQRAPTACGERTASQPHPPSSARECRRCDIKAIVNDKSRRHAAKSERNAGRGDDGNRPTSQHVVDTGKAARPMGPAAPSSPDLARRSRARPRCPCCTRRN